MNLDKRITALEQRTQVKGFKVWFEIDGLYYAEPEGKPVEIPEDARGIIFAFTDDVTGELAQ